MHLDCDMISLKFLVQFFAICSGLQVRPRSSRLAAETTGSWGLSCVFFGTSPWKMELSMGESWENQRNPLQLDQLVGKMMENQWTGEVLIPHGDLPWGCYDVPGMICFFWDLMGGSPYPFLWFSNGFQISNVMIPNGSKVNQSDIW